MCAALAPGSRGVAYGELMSVRRAVTCVAVSAVLLSVLSPWQAEGAVTPVGAATVRGHWLGAHTLEGRPPEVLVGWSVTVGPGGNAGPVRLRVLRAGDPGTVVGSGPIEWLAAAPGVYRFGVSPGIPYDYRDSGLALDQQVGGHAIVRTHAPQPQLGRFADPAQLYALDVFRPPLAAGAFGVPYSERRLGEQLLVSAAIETDLDRDRLGDKTQDRGDLQLLNASVAKRSGRKVLIVARIHNVGTTVRHMPHLLARQAPAGVGWLCESLRPRLHQRVPRCPGPAVAPGARVDLRQKFALNNTRLPKLVELASEGPDATPADNRGRLKPWLRLRTANRRALKFSLATTRPGTAKVVVRVAGVRLVRKVRFKGAGRRSLKFLPARRADRRRLDATRQRPGRLPIIVTATMSVARASLRVQL